MITIRQLTPALVCLAVISTTGCGAVVGNEDMGVSVVTQTSVRPTIIAPTTPVQKVTTPSPTTTSTRLPAVTTIPSMSTATVHAPPPPPNKVVPPPLPPPTKSNPTRQYIDSNPTGQLASCTEESSLRIYNGGVITKGGTTVTSRQSIDGGFIVTFSGNAPPASAEGMLVFIEFEGNDVIYPSEFHAAWIGTGVGQSPSIRINPTSNGQDSRYITYLSICGWP